MSESVLTTVMMAVPVELAGYTTAVTGEALPPRGAIVAMALTPQLYKRRPLFCSLSTIPTALPRVISLPIFLKLLSFVGDTRFSSLAPAFVVILLTVSLSFSLYFLFFILIFTSLSFTTIHLLLISSAFFVSNTDSLVPH